MSLITRVRFLDEIPLKSASFRVELEILGNWRIPIVGFRGGVRNMYRGIASFRQEFSYWLLDGFASSNKNDLFERSTGKMSLFLPRLQIPVPVPVPFDRYHYLPPLSAKAVEYQ